MNIPPSKENHPQLMALICPLIVKPLSYIRLSVLTIAQDLKAQGIIGLFFLIFSTFHNSMCLWHNAQKEIHHFTTHCNHIKCFTLHSLTKPIKWLNCAAVNLFLTEASLSLIRTAICNSHANSWFY